MKYYIVYFEGINQYGKVNSGYYVNYKDKLEDNFSSSYILAKRYKTLGNALNRAGLGCSESSAISTIKTINRYLFNDEKIKKQIDRKRKLQKLKDEEYPEIDVKKFINSIDMFGILQLGCGIINVRIESIDINENVISKPEIVSNKEIYDFIDIKARKYTKKLDPTYNYDSKPIMEKNATEEDICDFCS